MNPGNVFTKIGVWLFIGYLFFLAAVRLDPDAEALIQDNEKVMVALIILWPILAYSLLKYFYARWKNE